MTTVLKLGGSVVTVKDDPERVDEAALADAADALADAAGTGADATAAEGTDGEGVPASDTRADPDPDSRSAAGDLVVVHGGGSFGHHHAAAHGVSTTAGTHDPAAVSDVHGAMTRLNRRVVDALLARGVPAVPVHPLSLGARDAAGDLSLPTESVAALLGEGFVPVLHGDLVAHRGEGVTVVSGDELVTSLASALGADRVGTCSTVPGVLDGDGAVIDRIEAFDDAAALLGGADSTDVTGGMAAKVRALLALGAPAFVFGPAELPAFLAGEDVGTRIDGG